ncbi:MAG: type II toxin-antitoxin system Phd/YefM family antitoxin [Rhizomicrobium sp.]|nr:type II toxin-antitoxin system Phd/YefM family antitoxin [Rhizomicrobium sp.]
MTKLSSREFNQDVGRAKRAAEAGPVIITDRGKPAYVLVTYDAYRALAQAAPSILDLLDQHGAGETEFEAPALASGSLKPASFA